MDKIKMRIFSVILLFIFLIIGCCADISRNDDFPFERKVWSFWDSEDFTQASIFVQACYEKIKMSAEKAGFEYILLSNKNLPQYITNYEDNIVKVREKSVQEGLPAFADLVRINVLHEHGGIWMDITEILINDFDWLLNIKSEKYRNLITNRFSEEPEALFFYNPNFQNSAEHRIQLNEQPTKTILYNEIPAFEAWFLAAKKNNAVIGEIKEVYSRFTQIPYQQLFKIFIDEEIYMHNQDGIGYLTINYAISYVLQKRQKELDKTISLYGNRLTVYEYYNLWGLSAFLGPLTWTNDESANILHLMDRKTEYFEERGWIMNFFIKIVGHFNKQFTKKLTLLHNIFTKFEGSFEKFMNSNPSENECLENYFIVEESFLQKFFTNTTYLENEKIKVITENENKKWSKYCEEKYNINNEQSKVSLFGTVVDFLLYLKVREAVPWYKTHNTVNFGKDYLNFSEKFKDWFFANSAYFGFWIKFFIDGAIWFLIQYSVLQYLSKKYVKRELDIFKDTEQKSSTKLMTSFAIILGNAVSLYEYHMVDQFGERDRPFETFFSVTVIFILQNFIEERVKNDKNNQLCYEVTLPFISFRTTFTVLNLMRNNKNRLTFYSIIIGLTGPCLLRLYERMAAQKPLQTTLSKIVKKIIDKKLHRKSLTVLLLLIWLIPNLRYILISDYYLLSFLPVILLILIVLIFVDILIESFRRNENLEVFRILLLGCLSIKIYLMVPIRNEVIEYNFHRVLWTFLAITVYQSIYVQIGNDFLMDNKEKFEQLSLEQYIIKRKNEILVCFGLLGVELIIGSFSWMERIPFNDKLGYFEGLFLGFCNFLTAVYLHINYMNQKEHSEDSIMKIKGKEYNFSSIEKFKEVEMQFENEWEEDD